MSVCVNLVKPLTRMGDFAINIVALRLEFCLTPLYLFLDYLRSLNSLVNDFPPHVPIESGTNMLVRSGVRFFGKFVRPSATAALGCLT